MAEDAEAGLEAAKATDNRHDDHRFFRADRDPRVIRVAAFARALAIDEVPQLLNVVRGRWRSSGLDR